MCTESRQGAGGAEAQDCDGWMVGCVEKRNLSSSNIEYHEMSRKGLGNKVILFAL